MKFFIKKSKKLIDMKIKIDIYNIIIKIRIENILVIGFFLEYS
jgi:hypothetical protein